MSTQIIKTIMNKYINEDIIKLLNENKLDYQSIFKLYNNIGNDLKNHDINSYEINKFLLKYPKSNYNKFVRYKNKYILSNALNSNFWYKNIEELHKLSNNPDIDIKKKYIKLFKEKYINNWDGFWTSIKINNKGKIISINTIDIDDINYIIK